MYVLFSIYFSEINLLIKNIGEKNLLFQGIHIENKLNARNATWLLDVQILQMFKCSNVQMFKCSNVQIGCSNVQMFKCSNVQMFKLDVQMFKFFKINIENLKKWIDEIKTTQKKSNCDFDCGCHKSQRDESLKLSIIGELKHRILCN
jgi:hypothetical protein